METHMTLNGNRNGASASFGGGIASGATSILAYGFVALFTLWALLLGEQMDHN